jgi:hypothetical protein
METLSVTGRVVKATSNSITDFRTDLNERLCELLNLRNTRVGLIRSAPSKSLTLEKRVRDRLPFLCPHILLVGDFVVLYSLKKSNFDKFIESSRQRIRGQCE